jgi:hypothetical protein
VGDMHDICPRTQKRRVESGSTCPLISCTPFRPVWWEFQFYSSRPGCEHEINRASKFVRNQIAYEICAKAGLDLG